MLEVGIPFCKTRPASVVPDHGPVLGGQEQKSCSSFRHFVPRFLVKNYEKRREGETDENGRDPVQVP